ncbi:MAG: FAD-dependent oxidoreductase [Deltaproteobacteria bacterium]|nr:FAD-dependent oxidoreductase [Deltaproteobacteria bacterium]
MTESGDDARPVVIIGGGPAGSVCAAVLARQGVPCLLLEKGRHPRHHVGESLQPATLDLLELHLGVRDAIESQGYAHKYGAVYVWGESQEPWSILFDERLEESIDTMSEEELLAGDYERAVQVDRASFDALLFDAALHTGVDARQEQAVTNLHFADDGAITAVELADGQRLPCRFVVDCSGQRCLVGHRLRWVRTSPDLRSVASYVYLEGAGGLPGPLGRHVQYVHSVPEGWLWFIPIGADLTSVGLVTRGSRRWDAEALLQLGERAGLPIADARLAEVHGQRTARHARDWSFHCERFAGPNFLLAGDAACFVDPILSGGVDFAVRSGANAALAILEAVRSGEAAGPFEAYEAAQRRDFRAYLRMARYWYGNNRSVGGFFWEAQQEVPAGAVSTPLRAFVYLTSGRYAADKHLKIFQEWQEKKMFDALGVDRGKVRRALDDRDGDASRRS